MTGADDPGRERDTAELVAQLLGGDDFPAGEASAPPTHWPTLATEDVEAEMRALYAWVVGLQHRFREMFRLPACWYRHNGLVEILSALRDHERASYADTAPPTGAYAWMTAFRDVEARLRVWVAELRCGGDPRYHDSAVHAVTVADTDPPADLVAWVAEATQARRDAGIRAAVGIALPE